jgi:hypothetical protein
MYIKSMTIGDEYVRIHMGGNSNGACLLGSCMCNDLGGEKSKSIDQIKPLRLSSIADGGEVR